MAPVAIRLGYGSACLARVAGVRASRSAPPFSTISIALSIAFMRRYRRLSQSPSHPTPFRDTEANAYEMDSSFQRRYVSFRRQGAAVFLGVDGGTAVGHALAWRGTARNGTTSTVSAVASIIPVPIPSK